MFKHVLLHDFGSEVRFIARKWNEMPPQVLLLGAFAKKKKEEEAETPKDRLSTPMTPPICKNIQTKNMPLNTRNQLGLHTSYAAFPPQITSLQLPDHLIRPIKLILDGTSNPQRRHRGPYTPLAPQDPVIQRIPRRRLQKPYEVPGRNFWYQRHGGRRYSLIHQKSPNTRRK